MNNLKNGISLSIDSISRCSNQNIMLSNIFICFRRSLYTSNILNTKRGAGKAEGRMTEEALRKMVANEERGIFRKLDIGLPKPWVAELKKTAQTAAVKAAPR